MSDIYLSITETPTVVTLSQPVISGALSSTVTVANTVTVALDANSLSALEQVTVTVGAAVSVSNFPATQVVSVSNLPAATTVTGTVALDSASLAALENVTVTVGGAVSVSNFPATQPIAGSVTVANFPDPQKIGFLVPGGSGISTVAYNQGLPVDIVSIQSNLNPLPISGTVTIGSLPAISGTVTAYTDFDQYGYPCVVLGYNSPAGVSRVNYTSGIPIQSSIDAITNEKIPIGVSGTITVGNSVTIGSCVTHGVNVANSVTIGSLPAISGTVTANLSKPTWTDYSGTVVTANSAVTAISTTSRNYLLAQVTTGQMFLNIGATASTGNSVYFSAGQGFAWETSVPQGIVSIISSVTGTNYVLKDG